MSSDTFASRHIGPRGSDLQRMLQTIGVESFDELIDKTVPSNIRLKSTLNLPMAMGEYEYLSHIRKLGSINRQFRSFIGQGYYGVDVTSVVLLSYIENQLSFN